MTQENDVVTTPAEEVNQPETTENQEQETPEEEKEETIGEAFSEKKETDHIPKARLDKEIARRKELEGALAELQEKATQQDLSKSEISSDLTALAKEHDIDPSFLNKLAGAIKSQAEADFEERLKPFTEKEKQAKQDAAFKQGFDRAMANLQDLKDVVNPAVIKSLSLDPANSKKTFTQLIEEAYGNTVPGRKTVEKAVPRGGNASGQLDYARAKRDPDYFKEVMADPVMKKQYNDREYEN